MSHPKTESSTFISQVGLKNWPLNYPAFEVLSPSARTDLVICEHGGISAGLFEWVFPKSSDSLQSSFDVDLNLPAWDLLSDEALLNFERELN
ncbi:MAG: hypothetical protein QME78_07010 [Thermodesulfobacteriota bacterium]|nr:hypothetical protein [Thermodesulfobacteriota bacterium]